MSPFQPIQWEETPMTANDTQGLQNAITNAFNSGLPTRIEILNNIALTATLNVPAGAVIYFASAVGGPFELDATGQFRIMNVQTAPAGVGDTTIYFGDIKLTGGQGIPDGGALHTEGTGSAIIVLEDGAVFENNAATNGGAISIAKGAVGVFGGSLISNQAYGKGGAIYVVEGYGESDEAFRMNETSGPALIDQNTANFQGAGVYVENAGHMAIIEAGTISANHASGTGGGLHVRGLEMTGGTITGNISDAGGGGVFLDGPGTISGGSVISQNTTSVSGGGIHMTEAEDASLDITGEVQIIGNQALGIGGGGIYVHRSKLWDLRVGPNVFFDENFAQWGYEERFPEDDEVYEANVEATNWSADFDQGYNNFDINYGADAPDPANVELVMGKNAVGGPMTGGEFAFAIVDESGNTVATGENNANGLITFTPISLSHMGSYEFTAKETDGPQDWDLDESEWPVTIEVTHFEGELQALVNYPNGVPAFVNIKQGEDCGTFEFPSLTFDAAGTYEFTLKEETPSGGGWATDDGEFRVTVRVVDDGHGNLIATMSYPDGFPSFTNTYTTAPAHIIISGIKTAVGAPLPCGRFTFGLYDEEGELVSTATNGPAPA